MPPALIQLPALTLSNEARHSYLMILFKMPGLSSGLQTAQEGLHSCLCPSGVTALCDTLRVHSGSNIHFPGCGQDYWPEELRASKAPDEPPWQVVPPPPAPHPALEVPLI